MKTNRVIEQQKPLLIRTKLLKFIINNKMSVREFCENAQRTRLKSTTDLNKVNQKQ